MKVHIILVGKRNDGSKDKDRPIDAVFMAIRYLVSQPNDTNLFCFQSHIKRVSLGKSENEYFML